MKSFVSRFVALPDPLKLGIAGVVLWLVSTLFANLIILVPFLVFLEQFKEPLALAISAALIEIGRAHV